MSVDSYGQWQGGRYVIYFFKKKSANLGDIFCINNIVRIIRFFYNVTFEPSSAKIWCKPLTSSLLLATGRVSALPLMLTPPPLPLLPPPLRKKYVVLGFMRKKYSVVDYYYLINLRYASNNQRFSSNQSLMRFMGETPKTISNSIGISQPMGTFWCFGNGSDFWGHVAGGWCGHLILISDNPEFSPFIILHRPHCHFWSGVTGGNWKMCDQKISK